MSQPTDQPGHMPVPAALVPTAPVKNGDSGRDVESATSYLKRFGYLPNADLARAYPSWRPAIAFAPADSATFDDRLESA